MKKEGDLVIIEMRGIDGRQIDFKKEDKRKVKECNLAVDKGWKNVYK
jgi:hypothetical protein